VLTTATLATVNGLWAASGTNGLVLPANEGIDITNASGAFTTGTGVAFVWILYSILGCSDAGLGVKTSRTLLASASRTASTACAKQTDVDAAALRLYLDVSAISGSGGLWAVFRGYDRVSGHTVELSTGGDAISQIGTYCYELCQFPGTACGGVNGCGNAARAVSVGRAGEARGQLGVHLLAVSGHREELSKENKSGLFGIRVGPQTLADGVPQASARGSKEGALITANLAGYYEERWPAGRCSRSPSTPSQRPSTREHRSGGGRRGHAVRTVQPGRIGQELGADRVRTGLYFGHGSGRPVFTATSPTSPPRRRPDHPEQPVGGGASSVAKPNASAAGVTLTSGLAPVTHKVANFANTATAAAAAFRWARWSRSTANWWCPRALAGFRCSRAPALRLSLA